MYPRQASCAIALSLFTITASAGEPCEDNFVASGNLLTGKTYHTTANIANANPRDAFDGAMSYTTGNGFTVRSSDKNAGTISAVQANNPRVPLGILMSPDGANTKIAFSYLTPAGVHSPEDAIKKHFCNTVVAATNTARAAAAVPPPTPVVTPLAPPQEAIAAQQQVLPALRPVKRSLVGYATITPEQMQTIDVALTKNIADQKIRDLVASAAPAITLMAERISCLASSDGYKAMNEFSAPGSDLSFSIGFSVPMNNMRYHDKKVCLTVLRFNGWTAPANNALSYEVTYKAEDSGETFARKQTVVRQTDGTWLFK